MPYQLIQRGSGYVVKNTETGREHSKKPIPKKRAESQMRLLQAIQYGFRPTGKKWYDRILWKPALYVVRGRRRRSFFVFRGSLNTRKNDGVVTVSECIKRWKRQSSFYIPEQNKKPTIPFLSHDLLIYLRGYDCFSIIEYSILFFIDAKNSVKK